MDMKKRWMIILITISMVVSGSMAFAGDGVQDKATSQTSLTNKMTLANNNQTSPQVNDKALENLRVEQEEMGESMMILADIGEACETLCNIYRWGCTEVSQCEPPDGYCEQICFLCSCDGCP
jgi:hypothetical protein